MTTIRTKLYNGEVELTFSSFGHKYFITDEKNNKYKESVKSVTTSNSIIAKPALIGWAARMAAEHYKSCIKPGKSYDEVELMTIYDEAKSAHRKKKEYAGELGTIVHNWVEDYINGKEPAMPINKDLSDSVQKFLDWEKEHDVKFLVAEQQIYSRKYIFTGTLDFICVIDGEMYIGDLKTSSGVYMEMLLQTAAYRFARTEEYPEEKYKGLVIVRVGKDDGELEVVKIDDEVKYGRLTGYEWYTKFFTAYIAAQKLDELSELIKNFKY